MNADRMIDSPRLARKAREGLAREQTTAVQTKIYRIQWRPCTRDSWIDINGEEYLHQNQAAQRLIYWIRIGFPVEFRIEEGTL